MLKIFTIHDIATESYSAPFTCKARGEATRMFSDMANKKDNQIGQHTADFFLFLIGEFDETTGLIVSNPPVNCGHALDFVTSV